MNALPIYYSTFIVGVIPELLNVVWMVVVMLLVVAILDLCCTAVVCILIPDCLFGRQSHANEYHNTQTMHLD